MSVIVASMLSLSSFTDMTIACEIRRRGRAALSKARRARGAELRTASQPGRTRPAHSAFYGKTLANAVFADPNLDYRAFSVIHLRRIATLTALVVVAALPLAGCGADRTDPRSALRAWVAEAEQEAEERDRRALIRRVSESYADARGNDREKLDQLFRFYFLRQKNFAFLTTIDDIQVFEDSAAEMTLTVAMAGSTGGLNVSADAYRFELELEKQSGDWQLIGARWGELGRELL